MRGSIRVSFAGTYREAVAYCRDKPDITAPKGLATAGEDVGLPMLCSRFVDHADYLVKAAALEALGWLPENQEVVVQGTGFHGTQPRKVA